MAKRKPFYGPRQASWEVFLDGRHVTLSRTLEPAIRQAQEAIVAGRTARVVRWEACPHPGCRDGQVLKRDRRGCIRFPATKCPQCDVIEAAPTATLEDVPSKWRCKTCTHCGVGMPPKSCPNCLSEADDRHGPHVREAVR